MEKFSREQGGDGLPLFARLIRDIGFPVFVALYLLFQVNPTLITIRETMVTLVETQRTMILQQNEMLRELRRNP